MILIRAEPGEVDSPIGSQMPITPVRMAVCRMRSVGADREVGVDDAGTVGNGAKEAGLRTKRPKSLGIVIPKIILKWSATGVIRTGICEMTKCIV